MPHDAAREYHLGQLMETMRSIASEVPAFLRWLKRALILLALYGSGPLLPLLSDDKAKLAADLIKAMR